MALKALDTEYGLRDNGNMAAGVRSTDDANNRVPRQQFCTGGEVGGNGSGLPLGLSLVTAGSSSWWRRTFSDPEEICAGFTVADTPTTAPRGRRTRPGGRPTAYLFVIADDSACSPPVNLSYTVMYAD